jgi:hypothetical protein
MNPKTFQVSLKRPFALLTRQAYLFHVHAGSHHEALEWVQQLFEGVDVKPTLYRWANPSAMPRIGNSDPVCIIDCDAFRRSTRRGGKHVTLETPEGEFRRSEEEVCSDLRKIFSHLQEQYYVSREDAQAAHRDFLRYGRENDKLRISAAIHNVQKARKWMDNLWGELQKQENALFEAELAKMSEMRAA